MSNNNNNLLNHKYGYKWFGSFKGFFRNLKFLLFDRRAYIKERAKYGYSMYDLVDFDDYLSHILVNGLRELADFTVSYGNNFEDLESWQEYLRVTADMFEFATADPDDLCKDRNPGLPSYSREYMEAYKKLRAQQKETLTRAFERLSDVFYDLWS